MNEFRNTGGAKIGIAKASWPFATLKVSRDKLELNVTVIGKLVFLPGDITAITPYRGYAFMGYGIKIHHNIAQYKDEVVFWSSTSPEQLINQINATGFMDNAVAMGAQAQAEVRTLQSQGGFAIKKPVVIGLVVVWNVFIVLGIIAMLLTDNIAFVNVGVGAAMITLLLFSLLVLASPVVAAKVLKPGYTVADVSKFLLFLIFIAVIMLISSGFTVFL